MLPRCDAHLDVGRKLLHEEERSTPQDLSAGFAIRSNRIIQRKKLKQEKKPKQKNHINVRAAFKDGAIKARGRRELLLIDSRGEEAVSREKQVMQVIFREDLPKEMEVSERKFLESSRGGRGRRNLVCQQPSRSCGATKNQPGALRRHCCLHLGPSHQFISGVGYFQQGKKSFLFFFSL